MDPGTDISAPVRYLRTQFGYLGKTTAAQCRCFFNTGLMALWAIGKTDG